MKYGTIFWLLFAILLIILSVLRNRVNKKRKTIILIVLILVFLLPLLLPRQFFGKWDAVPKLRGLTISKIILQPSEPKWEVNLIDTKKIIENKNQIDTLIYLLKKSEVYFPTRPSRIWETKISFISTGNDTVEIKIHKTSNNGTVIYTPTNEWRKDDVGNYLEKNCQLF